MTEVLTMNGEAYSKFLPGIVRLISERWAAETGKPLDQEERDELEGLLDEFFGRCG